MDDEADVLGRFMHIMDYYYRAERRGGRMPDYLYEWLERVLQSPAAIEQDIINQLIMVNIRDDQLMTPLQDVYENGHLNLFQIFLKNGADPNIRVVDNVNFSESILMYSIRNVRYNSIEYIKLLLKYGADVNYTNDGGTALHYAAANNNIEATRLILKYFPDTRLIDEDGETARDVAEDSGYDEIVRLIDDYRGRPFAAARRIQKQSRGRRTLRNLQKDLIKEQSKMLGERLPDSELMDPYISPMDRRELIKTLTRDRKQRKQRKTKIQRKIDLEDYDYDNDKHFYFSPRQKVKSRSIKYKRPFLRELEGGRRRRKNTRKKYRYRV